MSLPDKLFWFVVEPIILVILGYNLFRSGKPAAPWPPLVDRLKYHRSSHEHWRAEADEWRKRAEFAETYAAQLEAELDVPKIDRMNSNSWRHQFPQYKRFQLRPEE